MNEVNQRVAKCFLATFPELSPDSVATASVTTVPSWDSVAGITLVNLLEEEFQTQVDFEALPDLDSFDKVVEYMDKLLAGC